MSAPIPLLEIIFVLFLHLMPEGTKSFTIDSPSITWTLQHGQWSGVYEDDLYFFGPWTATDLKIIRVQKKGAPEVVVDVSPWVTRDESGFLVEGSRLKVDKTKEGHWLFVTEAEPFLTPVKIEFRR